MKRRALAWRPWLALCIGCLLGLAWPGGVAQGLGLARVSAVKAAYLYKFGSFVEWPAGAFAGPHAPLVIGVYGDDAVASDLEQLTAGREVEGRPVSVLRVRDARDAFAVHILFAGGPRFARIRELIEAVRGPVLTVSDGPVGGNPGPVLYFTENEGRVRFSASLAAAAAHGLRLSAKLLGVAQNVEGR
ncbi:MAG TPA: YfiR family protein [Ramlibacter sp.]|uniref:YfiR family protein n=1 Tax=Ramlibacter sp. TaxID=1917967 RepID=UPI002D7FBE67|nr:YfiR family protein [Ramlibacter sp.]HET8746895.1 YfiR family protein [Ramlibacter sp.]